MNYVMSLHYIDLQSLTYYYFYHACNTSNVGTGMLKHTLKTKKSKSGI